MKILHVDTGRGLRGGQHQLLMLLRGLKGRGHEQILLAQDEVLRQWPGHEVSATALWRASRQVDIVHAHSGRAHTLVAQFCWGKPIVVSRRVAFPLGQGLLSRWKYGRACKLLAVSEYVRRQLLAARIPDEKVCVVYDGVESSELSAARVTASAPLDRPLKVVTPRIDDILKPSALVGKACERIGAEFILSKDLKRDVPRGDIFAYLSESEGLGSAVLLAMAQRKPVVASRVGGLPELVIDERTGLLVDNTAESVAAALERFAGDRELAQRCIDTAFERVSSQFTGAIMVERTEAVYRSFVREPSAAE
ncbi:MAG: glycosyltransferase family 4 protein [Acidobacteria bacterium]|nr:glycosyltransferase family 4 protein [Acidobacteriota bacterium]